MNQVMSGRGLLFSERKRHWLDLVLRARATSRLSMLFLLSQLCAGLLPVADGIVSAEGNLLPSRQQKLLAAFHEVLLVKGPRVHKILQHNHEDEVRQALDVQTPIGKPALGARKRKVFGDFLRTLDGR